MRKPVTSEAPAFYAVGYRAHFIILLGGSSTLCCITLHCVIITIRFLLLSIILLAVLLCFITFHCVIIQSDSFGHHN